MPLVWYYCGKVHFILFALLPGSGSLGFKLLTVDLGAGLCLERKGLRMPFAIRVRLGECVWVLDRWCDLHCIHDGTG